MNIRHLIIFTAILLLSTNAFADRYWIFFTDKGIVPGQEQLALDRAQNSLTGRSLQRRAKTMTPLVDDNDIPVCHSYIESIRNSGVRIRTVSKWLNAVSIEANDPQLNSIQSLPFVKSTKLFSLVPISRDLDIRSSHATSLDDPNYGPSLAQNELCHIPELHAMGLSGNGIMMCFLDTGFRLDHQAFDSLNVIAVHDFIHNDDNVDEVIGEDSLFQALHGTAVLSTACGYFDGQLVGPAFGADLLCAKTEWIADETPVEEDFYIAALEWADSIGADITSSSLGYIDWYDQSILDGQSAVTTIGLNVATSHGILCVTAAGNERTSDWGTIVTPADADSILAVGAVDSLGILAGFSSPGPTFDGRIKPDIAAQGADVYCANYHQQDTYFRIGGTSLATPIIAGLAALIMEAHPDWTAQQVRTALLMTASQSGAPDNDLGYGIANGVAAVNYIFESATSQPTIPKHYVTISSYPNPFNSQTTIQLTLPYSMTGQLKIYDLLGRVVMNGNTQLWTAGINTTSFDAMNLSTGVYTVRFEGGKVSEAAKLVHLK